MNKKLALAVSVTAVASLGFAGTASARPPASGDATISGSLSGTPAYIDEVLIEGSVSGSLTLTVDQLDPDRDIVMANIDLGSGFSIDSVDNVEIVSNEESGDCDTSNMEVLYLGEDDITVKYFSCDDTDGDGDIEFSLVATGIDASTTNTVAGEYEVESQYRTNGSRKNKSFSWVVENETAITLADQV
ncbi:MAG: hypothetical protein ACO307_11655 [Ilumatobacteraceae bacterium]